MKQMSLCLVSYVVACGMLALPALAEENGVHLFILSGQSNMAGLNPNLSFTPAVQKAFGADHVVVVKSAQGGQPIRRWYQDWKPAEGDSPAATGDLYDRLMESVKKAVGDKKPASITFVWMQGERDAREQHGSVYAASLKGLVEQLRRDMGRQDINFIIGRLSDCGNDGKRGPDWMVVRQAQAKVAEQDPRGAWVDTDDLNGPKDDLHYTKDGYVTLGSRFAEQAIALIGKQGKP